MKTEHCESIMQPQGAQGKTVSAVLEISMSDSDINAPGLIFTDRGSSVLLGRAAGIEVLQSSIKSLAKKR